MRAWPAELNRSDLKGAPCSKLKHPEEQSGELKDYFICSNEINEILDASQIPEDQLEKWKNCLPENGNFSQEENVEFLKTSLTAINKRFLHIYKKWYDDLNIEKLVEDDPNKAV